MVRKTDQNLNFPRVLGSSLICYTQFMQMKAPYFEGSSWAIDWTRILSLDSRAAVGGEKRRGSFPRTRTALRCCCPSFLVDQNSVSATDFTETWRLVLTCGFDCTIADGGTLLSTIEQLAVTYRSWLKAGLHVVWMLQAKPRRSKEQQQQQSSPNLGSTL